MAKSRAQRRQLAKERLIAKSVRIANASEAARLSGVRLKVEANLASPPKRNYYPESNLASFAGLSHRGYVCKAGGSMDRRRALALKARGSY